ncbi:MULTISPECIES: thioredoxin domain-containing protein [Synechococcaceae]|uniref:TlpA family protein disulfide reductase n=1 Tax=Synechococcaceae TaxID=1890426 RepID=UPI0008FF26B5|nr:MULTISPECIES: thioredoxin domain-containing protein [Synechococcaceae]MCT0246195.1 redoxin domain-containing protein [Synechococcus sp. CS-601]MCT4365145.1 thioredoxin domain-containing protein [Candidatus Regnicoccus frigidus MAG-AL1]MCT4367803.1 thioredoxin domain-containing protein [Candidatus Regnicoccus frigidus MAG-AL2]TWB86925.1 thioredoxin [Synechococcus sp. Ace-Pa]
MAPIVTQSIPKFAAIAILGVGITTAFSNPQGVQKFVSEAISHPAQAQTTGKLAQQLQGKPVVVDVYASWCSACKNIAPTLSQLKQKYAGAVNFVVLDVSDRASTAKSEATARKLGLSNFFAANKTQTGSLTIIDPATGKILAQHRNNPNKSAYTKVLDAAISRK